MLLRACLVASFALAAAGAQVIPVAASALSAAIQAAPPGAVLLVSGVGNFVNVTVNKDVTIACTSGSGFVGGLSVRVGPQNTLRLSGVQVVSYVYWHYGGASYIGGGIHTDGNLHAENCTCEEIGVEGPHPLRTVFLRNVTAVAPPHVGLRRSELYDVAAVIVDSSFRGGASTSTSVPGQSGLVVNGTLRAERSSFTVGAGPTSVPWPWWWPATAGLVLHGNATLAGCTVSGAGTGALGLIHDPGDTVILSGTTISGGSAQPTVQQLLPTASLTGSLSLGTSPVLTCREQPNALVAVVLAGDLHPWSSPFAQGLLWFGATPNWTVAAIGVTDPIGAFAYPFTIPNVAALQYTVGWFTGVFVDPLPLRTTAPIGGMIR